eukprot:CAMPEP_0119126418 /NCGR_PEP_ID=MMETSP1310-20130426/5353_1 /TAXON_ID=464262 /ORGANISM="Genus nov. species nov., Strain RCC2339" /LENGTH=241 /DNA_ID=CAMNT_0007116579 /DNA_START=187 /DNA_END=909 /DNA_ORIENTATION=+
MSDTRETLLEAACMFQGRSSINSGEGSGGRSYRLSVSVPRGISEGGEPPRAPLLVAGSCGVDLVANAEEFSLSLCSEVRLIKSLEYATSVATATAELEWVRAERVHDCGSQPWRAGLFLVDLVLSRHLSLSGAAILEVGAGIGLVSILLHYVLGPEASIIATDRPGPQLDLLRRNVLRNVTRGVTVEALDLLADGGGEPKSPTVIVGTELVYSSELTEALVEFLHQRITGSTVSAYIAVEW